MRTALCPCLATLAVTALLYTGPQPADAATFTLSPVADARIISYAGALDTQNYAADILSVYTSSGGNNIQRTLMRFDFSQVVLTGNERIESALLDLVASTGFGGNPNRPMEIHRVLAPWNEQTLTWLQRDTNLPWNKPGGDFTGHSGQPYAVSTAAPGNTDHVIWDITRLVDEWVEQAHPNYGLLLLSYDGNGLTFYQREAPATNFRPKLTITTGQGLPRLKISSLPGQVRLAWRGIGFAALQESAGIGDTWADSSLPVVAEGEESVARFNPGAAPRFFRLRAAE